MLFSIIVPIYNVENYLDKCLKSILFQTYKNFEVLMICDDSSDNSNIIAKEYSTKYNNFKMIYKKNTGLAQAKNIGLSKASGDYIIFVDGDDYIEQNLLQTLVDEKLDKYDLLRFQAREIKDNNIIVFPTGNWLTKEMYYNAQKNESYMLTNAVIEEGYITNNSDYADNLLDVSNDILIYDLIRNSRIKSSKVDENKIIGEVK